jgi:carboxybiotin decarboxylase
MPTETLEILQLLVIKTGVYQLTLGNVLMIAIGCGFIYLAIARHFEPYELLAIGLGAILINLPGHQVGVMSTEMQASGVLGLISHFALFQNNLFPPLIFLCLGAMTDFGPLLANPRLILLGAAAQIGVFVAFFGALALGFDLKEAASIGIIGGADGPTTIYAGAKLAPHLLGITAVTAYSYMGLVPVIQPPIMRLLTTQKERKIKMKEMRKIPKLAKILLPLIMMIVIILLIPMSAPLVSMFMIGNIFRESGVVDRLTKSAQNELLNIVTIFLMLCIGLTLDANKVLNPVTLKILALGLVAFAIGTAGGILFAKFMNLFSKNKINPLVGAAGVSAVPMAARLAHEMALKEDPSNFLLMHAMGPNVAGVIGSAMVAGYFLSILQ